MTVRRIAAFVLGLGLLPPWDVASAYELRTHALMAEHAFEASGELGAYLEAVGIQKDDVLDQTEVTAPPRLDFYVNNATPKGWLAEGAIREDDFQKHFIARIFGCPQPFNPPSGIDRLVNHFLDVQQEGRGLTYPPIFGIPAQHWALGFLGRGPEPSGNAFTIVDARAYQLESLTAASRTDREKAAAKLFRALGQVIHVLQDMAQPQHTRNDPHAGCFFNIGGEKSWYELYIESRAKRLPFRRRGEVAPELPLAGYDTAPHPTTLDFGYPDFFTRGDRKGLANFSSRNFFTAGTNLEVCGGYIFPTCDASLYTHVDTPFDFPVLGGGRATGIVTLVERTAADQLTGNPVPDIAVSSRSVWDQHLEREGREAIYTLNTLNYDAMGDALLPRAAGYSVGLLDYVFRAKLDATIERVQAGDPPIDTDRLRLAAVNASRDLMFDGTLTILYERTTGERVPVTVAVPPPVPGRPGVVENVSASAFDPLPVVEFVEPTDTVAKYVIVYQGGLGKEAAGIPDGSVGAVVARVIDVGWVERIVALGEQRRLTNARGEFAFPPPVDRLERVRFGDRNNWVVGTASDDANPMLPDRVRAFQIARPVDDTSVPLQPDPISGVEHIALADGRDVPFPYGLDLGVQVNFSSSLTNTHHLVIIEVTHGEGGGLEVVERDKTTVSASAGWNARLVLDRSRLMEIAGETAGPYVWRVAEVGLDARQRLLALIEVRLNRVSFVTQIGTEERLTEECEIVPGLSILATAGGVPDIGSIWAVVDVAAGTVLGVSSEPTVNIGITSTGGTSSTYFKDIFRPAEGGEILACKLPFEVLSPDPEDQSPPFATITETASTTFRNITGQYRPDIKKVAGSYLTPISGSNSDDVILVHAQGGPILAAPKIRYTTPFAGQAGYLTFLREGMRLAPGDRPQAAYLLRFARPIGTQAEGDEGLLARWVPESPNQTARALEGTLDPAVYQLKGTTPKWALIRKDGGSRMVLVDLGQKAVVRQYAGEEAAAVNDDFVLLPSRLLYHVETTHFYQANTLTETGAPPVLFGAPFTDPDPAAAYQVFGVR